MPQATYFQDADVATLTEQIKKLTYTENDVVLLLIGEHSTFDIPTLISALSQQDIPIVGGVFPSVIYGDQKYEAGIVANVLPSVTAPSVVKGLNGTDFHLTEMPEFPQGQQYTALVLVDGLTNHVALFLDRLFRVFSNSIRYVGGGAGSLSFVQKPCVFDRHGMYQDAALILWLKTTTTLGVRHGWQQLRGPLIATRTSGTVVHQLNNQPAFQMYSQIVKMKTGKTLTKENFFDIAKEYPLGIYHPGIDYIVRDPITFTDDNGLVCVGEVDAGSMVYILQGDKKQLIQHAQLATHEAMNNLEGIQHNLIVDCISRVLYLEDEFGKELGAVLDTLPKGSPTPFGMLSLGEIASFKTGRVEFFNKTLVVAALKNAS